MTGRWNAADVPAGTGMRDTGGTAGLRRAAAAPIQGLGLCDAELDALCDSILARIDVPSPTRAGGHAG